MKKKYDCSVTLDCIHELKRLCNSYSLGCEKCPFSETDCNFEELDDQMIFILQQWSDRHPETPKLTKKEFDFLNCFQFVEGMSIFRPTADSLVVEQSEFEVTIISIEPTLFEFIGVGEECTFEELFQLEVE